MDIYILAMFVIGNCNCAVSTLSLFIFSVFFVFPDQNNLNLLTSEYYIVVCFLAITELRRYVLHDLYL